MTGYCTAVLIKTCSLRNISAPAPNTPYRNTHARGIRDVLTHQFENDPGADREGSYREGRGGGGIKARKRGSAHCDAKEYHISRPSLGEQWNIEATITLYLSFWTTSVMGAHTLCVR